jgi:transposase
VQAHDIEREQDPAELRRIALAMHAQVEQLVAVLARKCKELESFKGSRDELQQTLALIDTLKNQARVADARAQRASEAVPKSPRGHDGPTEQTKLPKIDAPCTLEPSERVCDACGGELVEMTGQFEESELVDVVAISYHVKQVRRQKYACRCGGCIKTAPGPERAQAGGRYSLDVAIQIVLDKYLYHCPLARQTRVMAEHGLDVTPQTLWDQIYAIAERLKITASGLMKHVLAQPVIGLDQTSWPRLDGAGTKPWQMWCLTAPGAVVHRIRDDKSAKTFGELVGAYEGVIVCDALSTHEAGARGSSKIALAACWAHVFRRWEEAMPDHPEAVRALEWIGALYEIDARAGDDLARRAELRKSESAAVLAEMKEWIGEQASLKTLSIGKAAAYTIANWDRLTRFVDDLKIPLDNNGTERGLRGPVVGRRNHYGSKSRSGTQVASTFYSLLETAKLHDIDPRAYLRTAILAADRGRVLLPWDMPRSPPTAADATTSTA